MKGYAVENMNRCLADAARSETLAREITGRMRFVYARNARESFEDALKWEELAQEPVW